jgi:hypothetical protein
MYNEHTLFHSPLRPRLIDADLTRIPLQRHLLRRVDSRDRRRRVLLDVRVREREVDVERVPAGDGEEEPLRLEVQRGLVDVGAGLPGPD